MTRIIEVLISLAIVLALFLVVGLVLPSSRHIQEKIETNRKLTIVYDTLSSLKRFEDWNPLVLRDPRLDMKLSGPDAGVGARLDYESSKAQLGDGSWEIVAAEPNRSVTYAITNPRFGSNKTMTFTLEPTGRNNRNVEITQSYDVDYGWNIFGRYAGLYVSRHVGDDMKLALQKLSNLLAQVPNVDYRVQGSKLENIGIVELPAQDLLVVNAGSIERNNQKIENSMKANMEWIRRTMAANNLEPAGPMQIVSLELGRENYTFDVRQPVRRAGSGTADADETATDDTAGSGDTDAAAEGEGTDANKAPAQERAEIVAASGEPLEGLELLGPVEYERTEPGRYASGTYVGYMAELENVRNAVRAWAMTQDEEAQRSFEVYKNGIDKAFTSEGEYDVYWRLK
jgi:hypothetical protein